MPEIPSGRPVILRHASPLDFCSSAPARASTVRDSNCQRTLPFHATEPCNPSMPSHVSNAGSRSKIQSA